MYSLRIDLPADRDEDATDTAVAYSLELNLEPAGLTVSRTPVDGGKGEATQILIPIGVCGFLAPWLDKNMRTMNMISDAETSS